MNTFTPEILVNASQVIHRGFGDIYEFVLNDLLEVVECVHVASRTQGTVVDVPEPNLSLQGHLFHFNHVRVNPRLDNTHIIQRLRAEFRRIGVAVKEQKSHPSFVSPFKSIGELSHEVRFYLTQDSMRVVFLSPVAKPHLAFVNTSQATAVDERRA